MTPQEMNEKRLGIIAKQRDLNNKVAKEGRDFNGEEKQQYDAMEAEANQWKAKSDRAVTLEAAENELSQPTRAGIKPVLNAKDDSGRPLRPNSTPEYFGNFRSYMRGGEKHTPLQIVATLTKGTGTQVGYLAPVEYETAIRKAVYPLTIMRRLATVLSSESDSVIPLEGTLPTFGWIAELGTYPKTDLTVGRGGFSSYKLGGILLASEEILADAFVDLPAYIADRSKVAISQAEEAAYTIGDGNGKPTGVAVSASLGATSASATSPTADEVLDFMDSLTVQYQANARLMMTVGFRSKLRKLKDSTGQYLWQPGLQAGVPDQFNAKPIEISNYLSLPAAGNTAALFGDFSFYTILDRVGFYVRQLGELYAESGAVGFQINERTDGKLLNTAAVKKFVMAAS